MKRVLSAVLIALLFLSPCLTVCAGETEPETFASGDFTYVLLDDGTAEITKYKGKDKVLTLPSQLDHHSVTVIGDQAFAVCSTLTSVTIPDSVTTIGDSAFTCCSSLTAISIPDSITAIGGAAFSYCSNLTLTVGRNSYAAQYCKENGLNYTYPDSLD